MLVITGKSTQGPPARYPIETGRLSQKNPVVFGVQNKGGEPLESCFITQR